MDWHTTIDRKLPWKLTDDPYKIWLSEIILQQTRVEQGLPYYLKFIELFPSVHDLAAAHEDEVLHAWQGLGYYSRARNLHFAAKTIVTVFEGEFPRTYNEIKSLKGVGEYTAAAIASFAYGLPYPVVDGNVQRVITRIYGVSEAIDTKEGKSKIQELVESVFDTNAPAAFNQAIMDFGALQCQPKGPDCSACPFQDSCRAYATDMVNVIPIKSKKIKKRDRWFQYIFVTDGASTILHRRGQGDVWEGLYEFPLIESKKLSAVPWLDELNPQKLRDIVLKKHVLSHQNIFATVHIFKVDTLKGTNNSSFELVKLKNLMNFAFPVLLSKNMAQIVDDEGEFVGSDQ